MQSEPTIISGIGQSITELLFKGEAGVSGAMEQKTGLRIFIPKFNNVVHKPLLQKAVYSLD